MSRLFYRLEEMQDTMLTLILSTLFLANAQTLKKSLIKNASRLRGKGFALRRWERFGMGAL
jgi:hypothetical protein